MPKIPDNFNLNSILKQEEYSREKSLIRLICRMVVISFKNRIEGKFLNLIISQAPISFCSFSKCLWPIPEYNYMLFEYLHCHSIPFSSKLLCYEAWPRTFDEIMKTHERFWEQKKYCSYFRG